MIVRARGGVFVFAFAFAFACAFAFAVAFVCARACLFACDNKLCFLQNFYSVRKKYDSLATAAAAAAAAAATQCINKRGRKCIPLRIPTS